MAADIAYLTEDPTVLAFLSDPRSYADHPACIQAIETHMSRVFLAGSRVYKVKKPIRLSFIDLTTLDARRQSCERELALNQTLAPGVYLKVVPLVRRPNGSLALGGRGEVIEWLLVMQRLQDERLLHNAVGRREVQPADVDRIGEVLGSFYRKAKPIACTASELIKGWRSLIGLIEKSLGDPEFALPGEPVKRMVAGLRTFLDQNRPLVISRLEAGHIVDGHGDLRPEHIHLGPPVKVIDRLEFDDKLRRTDPFDEIGFLGLECDMLGAPWIGPRLVDCLSAQLNDRPPDQLLGFYRCYRAALRARLSIEHLRDPAMRTPERWPRQARAYLNMALECLPDQS